MSQKGGTAKTTTVVNLAAALGELGKRVLVLDLDPQANASAWLGYPDSPDEQGLFEVITGEQPLAEVIRPTEVKGVDIAPSSSWLVNTERALLGKPSGETNLRQALAAQPAKWDFALLDCPPTLGLLAVSALAAAEEVLVPVEAKVMALAGLASLVQTVESAKERLNPDLELSAILACRVTPTKLAREVLEQLRKTFRDRVLKTVVRENIRVAEAWSHGVPVTTYAPRCNGSQDYRAVAQELLARKRRRKASKRKASKRRARSKK